VPRTGAAERVPQRDGAAVGIDARRIEAQLFAAERRLRAARTGAHAFSPLLSRASNPTHASS
jgi:hypothetical protein